MSSLCLVMTTFETRDQAQLLANKLVETKVAACVHVVGPITSTYRWKGKVEIAEEWRCEAVVPQDRYPDVEKAILAQHPYELPAVVAVPIISGNAAYFEWALRQSDFL